MSMESKDIWWESLTHGGLVLSPSQISLFSGELEKISDYHWGRFRSILIQQQDNNDQPPLALIQYLFVTAQLSNKTFFS